MKKIVLVFVIFLAFVSACSEPFMKDPILPANNTDISQAINDITVIEKEDATNPSDV